MRNAVCKLKSRHNGCKALLSAFQHQQAYVCDDTGLKVLNGLVQRVNEIVLYIIQEERHCLLVLVYHDEDQLDQLLRILLDLFQQLLVGQHLIGNGLPQFLVILDAVQFIPLSLPLFYQIVSRVCHSTSSSFTTFRLPSTLVTYSPVILFITSMARIFSDDRVNSTPVLTNLVSHSNRS